MTITSAKVGFCPIMVDCETLGLTPNRNPVIQIAMVSFNPETLEPMAEFEIFLPLADQLAKGNVADQSTLNWWSKQTPKVIQHIADGMKQAEPMPETLVKIYQWVMNQTQEFHKKNPKFDLIKTMFWAKPTLFDFPFIEGLFRQHQQISPFHYQNVTDMKSSVIAMFQTAFLHIYKYSLDYGVAQDMYWLFNDWSKLTEKLEEDAHNATADCYYQIQWLKWSSLHLTNILEYFDQHGEVKGYIHTLTKT